MGEPPTLTIPTRVGWAGWNEHFHFGHRVFAELAGSESYTGLLALAVTGRRFSRSECDMLDDFAATMTIAEPRIWPMKVTRLVASYGRTVPAALAGTLCFESHLIGPWTTRETATLLMELMELAGANAPESAIEAATLELMAHHPRLIGFGVPFRAVDERVVALADCVARRGRDTLPYWSMSQRMWATVRESRQLEPNISAALAAAGLDLGLTPDELAPLTVALLQNIFWANAVEGARQAPAVLRRLPDDRVEYVGTKARKSPRSPPSSGP